MTTIAYQAELIDTETDEMVETFFFEAENADDAEELAWEEAAYQGLHVGVVRPR